MAVTLTELKRRYESGEKMNNTLRKRLDMQLKRVCGYKDCDKSLTFTRQGQFCSVNHRRAESSRLRTLNRQKKMRYEERHGIVRNKNLKSRKPTTGRPSTSAELLYENYKEPLRPIPKGKGYGFMGTIATTADHEYIQCHVCGNLFASLGTHVTKHGLSGDAYRELFGLMKSTALIGDGVRAKRIALSLISRNPNIKKGMSLPAHLVEYNRKVKEGEIQHPGQNTWSLERRNKEGLCPDQVLEKIKDLEDILGKTPSEDEFRAHYHGRFINSIRYQHGSWVNAVHLAGLVTRDELRKPSRDKLIMELQDFYDKFGRIPMTSDFRREYLRDKGVYIRVFGSLNNARLQAGMNAILPLPFGQKMELTPDEYIAYKAGHPIPGKVSKEVVDRRNKKAARKQSRLSRLIRGNV